MIGILDTVTFFILFLTILVLVGRGIWQLKKIDITQSFFVFTYIGLATFLIGLVALKLNYKLWDNLLIVKISIGLTFFSLLCINSLSVIKDITKKKLKTLLRLPIIGFLVGWYLKPFDLAIVIMVLELTQVVLFYKYKSTHLYCLRQQAKSVIGMFLAFGLYYNHNWLFYLGLTIYYVMKFQITNGVKLKLIMLEYKEVEA